MVLDEDLKPLHNLTEEGREFYNEHLSRISDEILLKHKHPILHFLNSKFHILNSKYKKELDRITKDRM